MRPLAATWWLIVYDIADTGRRRRVAKVLEGAGERVQWSVFECRLSVVELTELRARIVDVIDTREDAVRWYGRCRSCVSASLRLGCATPPDASGYTMV